MVAHESELEPIEPRTAYELFLDHKSVDCTDATVYNYRFRLKPFLEWCEENDVENLNDIPGRNLQTYRLWRRETSDINNLTMRMQMSALRVFLKWAASIEAVTENLYDKVMMPQVSPEEQQRNETLDAERAQRVLGYFSKFQYASNEHVLLALLWETGIRIGSANSLDVEDVDFENGHLRLVHRPDEGTRLKNVEGGERLIALTSDLAKLLGDYIDEIRNDLEDEYGRKPLLTTRQGRMSRVSMRRIIYRITAPCFFDEPCTDCSEGADRRCGDSVSPHAVRRGSITHYLSKDVPVDVVSDRMNVSRKVLEKHYDKRSEEVKVEQRREYIENI
jgi:site-specific recombinase XerD